MSEAQKASLPADLQTAEADLLNALKAALASGKGARWGATLRFENLRLLPVALRLFQSLRSLDASCRLLWPDAGAAALARRDAADLADSILDFNQWSVAGDFDGVVLAVGPQPSDYEQFMAICQEHRGSVVMLNGRLEDAAVGIGSVAANGVGVRVVLATGVLASAAGGRCTDADLPRRLVPLPTDDDGYRHLASMEGRPDPEQIAALLAGEDPTASTTAQQRGSIHRRSRS